MCKILKISRSLIYYKRKNKSNNIELENTIKQYKIHRNPVNNEKVENILNRKINRKSELDVVVNELMVLR